jgi:hypothetical protein
LNVDGAGVCCRAAAGEPAAGVVLGDRRAARVMHTDLCWGQGVAHPYRHVIGGRRLGGMA